MARPAGPHAGHRAEADEVADVARPVAGGPDLDVAVPGERARQVGDLALHAVRVSVARADHERATPAVGAEGEVELLLGEGTVAAGPAVALVQRVRDGQPERVRRSVALAEDDPQPERVALGQALTHAQLR